MGAAVGAFFFADLAIGASVFGAFAGVLVFGAVLDIASFVEAVELTATNTLFRGVDILSLTLTGFTKVEKVSGEGF